MSGECDIARKIEEYLWRKAFYDIIQKLKLDKKVSSYSSTQIHVVVLESKQIVLNFKCKHLLRFTNSQFTNGKIALKPYV